MITETYPNAPAVGSQGAVPASDTTTTKGLSSDFETFLKMLTAQARYQDPLEPIDSTEYAAQLAQFSMVEQQVKTNDTLTALLQQFGVQNAATLSAWVGMEARAVTPVFFEGKPITFATDPASTADQAFLVVSDIGGKELTRLAIPASGGIVQWDGVDGSGAVLPADTYQFSVESRLDGQVIASEPAAAYARVNEAQIDGNQVVLVMNGGISVLASEVTALRAPI